MDAQATQTGAPPILSVIDIGSSGIRMLLAELKPEGVVRQIERLERPLALGRETFGSGVLSAGSIQRAVNILRQYRERMDAYGTAHVRAVATSAIRAALNRDAFLDRVFLATGIEVEVIEGTQETLLTFAAVQKVLGAHPEVAAGDALLFELGGGSTEWALMRDGEVVASITHDLGTVRMRELLRDQGADRRAKTRLIQHNVREMTNTIRRSLSIQKVASLIAVGSEARFAARAIAGVSWSEVDVPSGAAAAEGALAAIAAKDLKRLGDEILSLSPDQTAATYSIPASESESLAPALLAYAELMRLNQVDRLLVPWVSMREGLLFQMARSIQSGTTLLFPAQTVAAAVHLARKYQVDEKHALQTAALARAIFEATRGQHRMGERELMLLDVAATVHDIGAFVAARGHHRHTYYLVMNSEVFGLSGMDREIVANVARYHRREGPQADHPAYATLPSQARLAVNRLAAILRVADALDKSHAQRVQDPTIRVAGDELWIEVTTEEDLALERMALTAKGGLFEQVFGLKPVLRDRV